MKTHGPKTPRSIRGLRNRRNLIGAIDAKSTQDADLSEGEIVNSFGTQFFSVTVPGNSTPFIVANQTGGRSFAPGSKVILASFRGRPGQAVIGGAPAGKKGGSSTQRTTRRRGTAAAESNQYAFGYADGSSLMVATLYNDGAYISWRASAAYIGEFTGCILSDESLIVGDGSALLHGGTVLRVWDVDGSATYSYSVPSGWTNPTALYYQNGYLYWCEFESIPEAGIGVGDPTFDYRLRRAATDLSSVTTIATVTSADASTYGAPFTTYQAAPSPWAFAVDSDGAVLYMSFEVTEIINHENTEWEGLQARFALSGGAPSTRAWSPSELTDGSVTAPTDGGFRTATVGSGFGIAVSYAAVHSVLAKSDDASAAATDLWGVSDLGSLPSASSFNAVDSGVLQVYGSGGATGSIYRGTVVGSIVTAAIDAFDETPNYPSALFYYGV